MQKILGRGNVLTKFWCGNLRKRANLEGIRVDRINLRILKNWDGLIWLRIGKSGGFYKMRRIP
jgi:hypothetical protein